MATGRGGIRVINPPKKPTYYRSRDNLKNFYIKVDLKKVRTTGPANTVPPVDSAQGAGAAAAQECEELVFRWQEKYFSQEEEELYSDANNCSNACEELYHRDVVELRNKGGRANTRLFSLTERDHFKGPVTMAGPVLLEPDSASTLTFAARHDHLVNRRHRARANRDLAPDAVRHPILESPSTDERLSHRLVGPSVKVMHLVADLRHLDGVDGPDEHILCRIAVDETGVIAVEPDFNPPPDQPAYRLENKHRELFEYRLEHASKPLTTEALVKEKKLMSELSQKRVSALGHAVGSSFVEDIPDDDSLRVVLYGEIVSAWGFEYNNLCVSAHLELPAEGWELEGEDCPLSPRSQLPCVVTQLCSTRSTYLRNVAHFNCPFEFSLLYRRNPDSSKEVLPKWPRVLVEVASLDFWDRHRIEGYSYLDIPRQSGLHSMRCETWRPVGRPVIDQMRRFFIGGPPEIDDFSFLTTPREFQGTHLSRYGFETETSGTVQFSFNIVHQSRGLVKEVQPESRYKAFKGALAAVLQSYQRAKDRALAASTTFTLTTPHS